MIGVSTVCPNTKYAIFLSRPWNRLKKCPEIRSSGQYFHYLRTLTL
jgi:hypothetical protein